MHCDITIQTAPFDLGAEEAALRAQAGDAGALVAFQGMVRGHDAAIPLTALFLEHYPGVTPEQIRRIAEDAAARWPLTAVRVIHRVGSLAPGEGIVLVLVASRPPRGARPAAFRRRGLPDGLPENRSAVLGSAKTLPTAASAWVDAKASDGDAAARWA